MRLPWPKIGTGTLLCRLLYGRPVLLKKSSKIHSVRSKESEAMAAMKEAVAVELRHELLDVAKRRRDAQAKRGQLRVRRIAQQRHVAVAPPPRHG